MHNRRRRIAKAQRKLITIGRQTLPRDSGARRQRIVRWRELAQHVFSAGNRPFSFLDMGFHFDGGPESSRAY